MKITESSNAMNVRPRILLGVTSDMSLRLLRSFPEHLAEAGWDVHVACAPGERLDERQNSRHVTYHAVDMVRTPHPWKDMGALVRWYRLMRKVRPDVTSVGTPKAALLGGLAAKFAQVPVRVLHQRGLVLETAKGPKRVVLRVTELLSTWSSTTVLSVSHSLKRVLVEEGLAPASKISVLGAGSSNGVETKEFESASFTTEEVARVGLAVGLPASKCIVGYVGRVTLDKGFGTLADAITQLKRAGEEFALLIVGGVEDVESRRLIAAVRAEGVEVLTTGAVPDPAIYYQLIDVLCLPTLREGLPNVVLEASAASRPVVTTDATGAVDSVLHGRTGLVVPRGDAVALASALSTLIRSPEMRRSMGAEARDFVASNFERHDVWANLVNFYSSLAEVRR